MNKSIFILIFIFIPLHTTFSFGDVSIYPSGEEMVYDLQGENGEDGINGINAYEMDCSDGVYRDGRDGEDGADAEPGRDGKDAIIYYEKLKDLKKITLYQKGGRPGTPGDGGHGTAGCNGGKPGEEGQRGAFASAGEYGKIFLINESIVLNKADSTKIISLEEFSKAPITLSKIIWEKRFGARSLFDPSSDIRNTYWYYKRIEDFEIKLRWRASTPIHRYFNNTKLAFSIQADNLSVTSYRGAIIDYRILREGQTFIFEVLDANRDDEFKNLDLVKMRGHGEDLYLEVKQKYRPPVAVKTRFVISLFNYKLGKESFIGQYELDEDLFIKEGNYYYLSIGQLNFPMRFKQKGAKLKVHLSIYRSARLQTRAFALKGLFKI